VRTVIEGNCSGNVTHGWATHGADVSFVEGSQILYTAAGEERGMTSAGGHACSQTKGEVALSDRMQEYWATFAKNGRPSAVASGGAVWPAFAEDESSAGTVMQLDVGEFGGLRKGLKAKQCEFWEKVAPLGPKRRQVED
jgi:carboxylesterase type B